MNLLFRNIFTASFGKRAVGFNQFRIPLEHTYFLYVILLKKLLHSYFCLTRMEKLRYQQDIDKNKVLISIEIYGKSFTVVKT